MIKKRQSATIADVAKKAGVSKATVSRVLNGTAVVLPETVKRVEEAMVQLDYQRNLLAASLVTGRTNTIGVLFTEPVEELYADPTFTSVLSGISAGVLQTDLVYALFQLSSEKECARALQIFRQGMIDGLIHLSPYRDPDFISALQQLDMPMVLLGQPGEKNITSVTNCCHIYADDVLGAEKAARHIQELGARNCAFIMGPENNVATKDRLIGYRNVLREDYSADKVYFGGWSSRSGRVLAEGIFRENPQVEAIFCGSDRIARGVIETALAWGRKVGEDLLVIGFDNHPFTTRTNPTITTVAQPFYKQGKLAVETLQNLLEGNPAQDQLLETWLVIRESTGNKLSA